MAALAFLLAGRVDALAGVVAFELGAVFLDVLFLGAVGFEVRGAAGGGRAWSRPPG